MPRVIRRTESESLDFVTSHGLQTSRRVTSSHRYDKHDVIADLGGPAKPVIPTPLSVRRRYPKSWVDVDTQWTVSHQGELVHEARLLTGQSGAIKIVNSRVFWVLKTPPSPLPKMFKKY